MLEALYLNSHAHFHSQHIIHMYNFSINISVSRDANEG